MSRVVKNVIVWLLALAVILCIVAGFTFGLSSVSGVASAAVVDSSSDSSSSNYVNGGVVRANILKYSTPDSLSENLRINYSLDNIDAIPFGDPSFDDYLYINDVENITIGDDGIWNITSKDSSAHFYYLKNIPSADISNTAFTFTIALHINTVSSGDYDYGLGYNTKNSYSDINYFRKKYFNLSNYNANDVVILSIDFSFSNVSTPFYAFCFDIAASGSGGECYASPLWFKAETYSLDEEKGFTGYVEFDKDYNDGYNSGYDEGYNAGVTDGTQSGYDDGYADGYDEGYTNGVADEIYITSQAFLSSAYRYMKKVENGVMSKYVYTLYENTEDKEIPLDGLFFAASDLAVFSDYGAPVPRDIHEIDTTGTSNIYEIVSKSQYALRFDSRLDQARWLVDNPMDNLVLFPTNDELTAGAFPAYYVMNDRSLLERFVSGAGAAFDLGYQGGYNDGYDAGDGAGYNRGYGVGFNDGQVDASSGNYTFLALIGSVLDAPISAFKGLLDFDLLGVNMSSFVLAIMSLCVIIVIIRVVLR